MSGFYIDGNEVPHFGIGAQCIDDATGCDILTLLRSVFNFTEFARRGRTSINATGGINMGYTVVVAAGNNQANAAALSPLSNHPFDVTGANGVKGAVLPNLASGQCCIVGSSYWTGVYEDTGTLKLYPATGQNLDGLGANVAKSVSPATLLLITSDGTNLTSKVI